jgi:spore coat polysaccharide biosynthesis predicted glycosyltransferase SpsG
LRATFTDLDVLVTAAGQTAAEAVATALPSVIIQTAENQHFNMRGWSQTAAVLSAGAIDDANWAHRLCSQLKVALPEQKRKRMVTEARKIDLGSSTERLARTLKEQAARE